MRKTSRSPSFETLFESKLAFQSGCSSLLGCLSYRVSFPPLPLLIAHLSVVLILEMMR